MSKELEKKVKSKKKRNIIIGIIIVAVALLLVVQFKFDAVNVVKDTLTGKETVKATLEISCKPLSDDVTKLKDKSKAEYIPENGVILEQTEYRMEKGDTAFDMLKEATTDEGIQAEYSYTQAYDAYFIEGISNLYNGDAGGMNGWLYYVNGKSPEYGISGYELKDGDNILVIFSCDGGEDVDVRDLLPDDISL